MADVIPDLVMDACCLINLYAAQNILAPALKATSPRRRIAGIEKPKARPALPFNLHVSSKVVKETLYIRKPDEEDANKLVEALIDLTPLVDDGVLHLCDLQGQTENDLFVQLATTLDDGEAMSMAIAKTRSWSLASDDRKARRLAGQLGVNLLTTAEVVKTWMESTKASDDDVREMLRRIQTFARFIPHRTMPLYQWWIDTVGGSS